MGFHVFFREDGFVVLGINIQMVRDRLDFFLTLGRNGWKRQRFIPGNRISGNRILRNRIVWNRWQCIHVEGVNCFTVGEIGTRGFAPRQSFGFLVYFVDAHRLKFIRRKEHNVQVQRFIGFFFIFSRRFFPGGGTGLFRIGRGCVLVGNGFYVDPVFARFVVNCGNRRSRFRNRNGLAVFIFLFHAVHRKGGNGIIRVGFRLGMGFFGGKVFVFLKDLHVLDPKIENVHRLLFIFLRNFRFVRFHFGKFNGLAHFLGSGRDFLIFKLNQVFGLGNVRVVFPSGDHLVQGLFGNFNREKFPGGSSFPVVSFARSGQTFHAAVHGFPVSQGFQGGFFVHLGLYVADLLNFLLRSFFPARLHVFFRNGFHCERLDRLTGFAHRADDGFKLLIVNLGVYIIREIRNFGR